MEESKETEPLASLTVQVCEGDGEGEGESGTQPEGEPSEKAESGGGAEDEEKATAAGGPSSPVGGRVYWSRRRVVYERGDRFDHAAQRQRSEASVGGGDGRGAAAAASTELFASGAPPSLSFESR